MPLPLNSMIRASSSGDHLLCFFAGDSSEWGGMLRFPPVPLGVGTFGGRIPGADVAGIVADLVLCLSADEAEGSFASGALRRREISTLTVETRGYRQC